jgi:hypothetical protein
VTKQERDAIIRLRAWANGKVDDFTGYPIYANVGVLKADILLIADLAERE